MIFYAFSPVPCAHQVLDSIIRLHDSDTERATMIDSFFRIRPSPLLAEALNRFSVSPRPLLFMVVLCTARSFSSLPRQYFFRSRAGPERTSAGHW